MGRVTLSDTAADQEVRLCTRSKANPFKEEWDGKTLQIAVCNAHCISAVFRCTEFMWGPEQWSLCPDPPQAAMVHHRLKETSGKVRAVGRIFLSTILHCPPPPPNTHTFGPTEGQNEQGQEANRRRQRQTTEDRGLVPTTPSLSLARAPRSARPSQVQFTWGVVLGTDPHKVLMGDQVPNDMIFCVEFRVRTPVGGPFEPVESDGVTENWQVLRVTGRALWGGGRTCAVCSAVWSLSLHWAAACGGRGVAMALRMPRDSRGCADLPICPSRDSGDQIFIPEPEGELLSCWKNGENGSRKNGKGLKLSHFSTIFLPFSSFFPPSPWNAFIHFPSCMWDDVPFTPVPPHFPVFPHFFPEELLLEKRPKDGRRNKRSETQGVWYCSNPPKYEQVLCLLGWSCQASWGCCYLGLLFVACFLAGSGGSP